MIDVNFYTVTLFALSAIIHGLSGIGFPLIVTTSLAFIMPFQNAIFISLWPTLLINLGSCLLGGNLKIAIKTHWKFISMCLLGSLLGSYLLLIIPAIYLEFLLASAIILYVFLTLKKIEFRFQAKLPFTPLMGVLAGIMGGATNAMSPLVLIYFLSIKATPKQTIQTANFCFMIGKICQLIIFYHQGAISFNSLTFIKNEFIFSLIALLALYISYHLRQYISVLLFKKIALIILSVFAIALLIRVFF